MLLHLVAGRWQLVTIPVPQASHAYFESLSMLSATEGWIIAFLAKSANGQTNAILLHLHDDVWSAVTMPFAGADDIMAVSPDDAWVSADTGMPACILNQLFHYQQGKWTSVPVPPDMIIYHLHRNGPNDAWATGVVQLSSTPLVADPSGYYQSPALLHFNGTSWSSVTLNGLQNPALELQMLSADEGWAVGTVVEGQPGVNRVTLLQHYVAGTWQPVALPNAPLEDITSFTCESLDDCWALGASPTIVPEPSTQPGTTSTFVFETNSLLHYYDGRWTIY